MKFGQQAEPTCQGTSRVRAVSCPAPSGLPLSCRRSGVVKLSVCLLAKWPVRRGLHAMADQGGSMRLPQQGCALLADVADGGQFSAPSPAPMPWRRGTLPGVDDQRQLGTGAADQHHVKAERLAGLDLLCADGWWLDYVRIGDLAEALQFVLRRGRGFKQLRVGQLRYSGQLCNLLPGHAGGAAQGITPNAPRRWSRHIRQAHRAGGHAIETVTGDRQVQIGQ